jgi:hypothetical protein
MPILVRVTLWGEGGAYSQGTSLDGFTEARAAGQHSPKSRRDTYEVASSLKLFAHSART